MRLEQFLFCEIARPEATGQFTLVGVVPGNVIDVVGSEVERKIAMPNFCCFGIFDYMQGVTELTTQLEVTKSAGSEVVARTPPISDRRGNPAARFHTQVFAFTPLQLPGVGEYHFKVILSAGGRTQSFSRRLTFVRRNQP